MNSVSDTGWSMLMVFFWTVYLVLQIYVWIRDARRKNRASNRSAMTPKGEI